jgi:serine/threonine/tyrosine-interacting protein
MAPAAPRLSEEQLRTVVQGPGDVEWRWVQATDHPTRGHPLIGQQHPFCRYEMRRECQEILPGLFLGPFVASKSLPMLQSLAITHM